MTLQIDRLTGRLPQRFPVGATYVVEGYGGGEGNLRVISRYVVLPGGRRINVSADFERPSPARASICRGDRLSSPSPSKTRAAPRRKKFAAVGGTKLGRGS
jgi:hypothetical protein